jgi:L-asparaginase II
VHEAIAVLVIRGAVRASQGRDQEAATDHQGREVSKAGDLHSINFKSANPTMSN